MWILLERLSGDNDIFEVLWMRFLIVAIGGEDMARFRGCVGGESEAKD
jgi:hypothetical protein